MEKWFKNLQSTLDRLIGDEEIASFNAKLDIADPNEKVIFQVTDLYTKKLLPLSVHYAMLAKPMAAVSLMDIRKCQENSKKNDALFHKSTQLARLFWDIIEESSGAKDIMVKRDFVIVECKTQQDVSPTILWLAGNSLFS